MKNLIQIKDYHLLRSIYIELYGECFDKDGKELVMESMPDDSGVSCENSNGDRIFKKPGEIYLTKEKFKRINL